MQNPTDYPPMQSKTCLESSLCVNPYKHDSEDTSLSEAFVKQVCLRFEIIRM